MSQYRETESGLVVPESASVSDMQDQAFLDNKEMESADNNMGFYWTVILIIAAVTSWAFGFLSVFTNDPIKDLRAGFWATVAGLIVLMLLDGSRYYWGQAKIAKGKTKPQRWVAWGMEIANFGGSFVASFMTLPYLLVWIGIPFTNDADLIQTMKLIIQWSFGVNLVAGFVFSMMSPHARKLASLSKIDSDFEDKVLLKLENWSSKSTTDLGDALERYKPEIQERQVRKQLAAALLRLGHGEIDELPAHHKVPSKKSPSVGSISSAMGGVPVGNGVNGRNGHR